MTRRSSGQGPIDDLLVLDGALTDENRERVLGVQMHEGIRFGEAALQLGLVQGYADLQIATSRAGDCIRVTRRHHSSRTAKPLIPSGAVVLGSALND